MFTDGRLKGLLLGAGATWTDSVRITNDPTLAHLETPSYALFRATVEYPFRVAERELRSSARTCSTANTPAASPAASRASSLRLSATF